MITIECDNCERRFEVRDDEAGTKTRCPYCGDVNRVPEVSAPDAPAAAIGAPPQTITPRRETLAEERELAVVRPAMFRAHPFRYVLMLALIIGGVALAALSQTMTGWEPWLIWPGLIIAGVGVGWFAWWWMSTHWWIRLIVTNKRTVRHEGVVKRHTTEVLHNHVRSVDIRQTMLERILNCGSIAIDSAGDELEIEVFDIPKPYDVKKLIDQHREM